MPESTTSRAGPSQHAATDATQVVNRDKVLVDAQADGLACVYCGRSWRADGSLAPLRSSDRTPAPGGRLATGRWSLTGGRTFRCEPPCHQARLAYHRVSDAGL